MSLAGKTIYKLWHRPIGLVRDSIRRGGPLAQFTAACGRSAMIASAATLSPPPIHPGPPRTLHFLTGRRHAYQTAFCLHSFSRHSRVATTPEFYDDGSLDADSRELLSRLAPDCSIHHTDTLKDRLDEFLPPARFPVLRERWRNYPHIRKIIDVHLGREGWRLVLDSDLLFWREPRFLLDWLTAPDRPLHAVDCKENYGYPRTTLEKLAGVPVPGLVNVGLCALRSDAIDWDFMEHASSILIRTHGTNYYLEQALVALLVARSASPCAVAPRTDYITNPSAAEIAHPTAVMHHYVDLSRDDYHRHAWRLCLG